MTDDSTVAWDRRLIDGRYRLGERLGRGAVAEVYRAYDERLARPVALKLFRGDAAEQLQRHESEMRTLAGLDHPSLVTVYDAGTDADEDQPYLVMQLVEGPTLADELRSGPLPLERTARYVAALAGALGYVHAQGFVHRDVKPANVLISDDGRVHLADFGIARLVDSAHTTRTGELLGTPAYFAPEQVAGEPVGPPADIYALGLLALECVTGRKAFDGTAMEVAMARLHRDPQVPSTLPATWQQLLRAMTARRPERRPTAEQVADALQRLATGGDADATTLLAPPAPEHTAVLPRTSVARPAPAPVPRRRGPAVFVVIVAVAIAAAVAVGIAVALHQNSASSPSPAFTPGTPQLPAPVESKMRDLERLVRR